MKKLTTLLALLAGVGFAFGQNTVVNFNNNNLTAPPDHLVYLDTVGGTKLVGTNFYAELFYVNGGGSLTEFAASQSRFRVTTTTSPGTWSGKSVTIPQGGPGIAMQLNVRVWDITKAASYDEAAAAGGQKGRYGESGLFNYTQDPALPAPPDATFMKNLPAFALVPEPSAIALGILGVAGLLIIRRRK